MTDRILPLTVWLDGETYRELAGHARIRHTDVGDLIARLAAASIKPQRRHTKITAEMRATARDMRALGYTWHLIADHLDCSVNGIMLALKRDGGDRNG